MKRSEDDVLRGALAYLDGAIELCPKSRWTVRATTFVQPMKRVLEAGEIMILVWIALLALPGVGLAVVLQQSIVGGAALTLVALLFGWSLYAFGSYDRAESTHNCYREQLREEVDQVERFFSEARRVPALAKHIGWEGQHPLSSNPKIMLRVLRKTRTKIAWLRTRRDPLPG